VAHCRLSLAVPAVPPHQRASALIPGSSSVPLPFTGGPSPRKVRATAAHCRSAAVFSPPNLCALVSLRLLRCTVNRQSSIARSAKEDASFSRYAAAHSSHRLSPEISVTVICAPVSALGVTVRYCPLLSGDSWSTEPSLRDGLCGGGCVAPGMNAWPRFVCPRGAPTAAARGTCACSPATFCGASRRGLGHALPAAARPEWPGYQRPTKVVSRARITAGATEGGVRLTARDA